MRSFLLVLCFVAFISKASGQQVYAEFDVESNRVDDIQAIPVGDSLFLTYTDKNIRKSFWVDATGQTAPVYFPHVEHLRFLAIERHDDTTYFYYLKKEDNFLKLYTLKQTPESESTRLSGAHVNLYEGNVMAIHQDRHNIMVLRYLKNSNRVEILSVSRGVKTAVVELPMPDDFHKLAPSCVYMNKPELNTIPKATAPAKIYKEGNSMIFTIDYDGFRVGESKTLIINIDLATGQHSQHIVAAKDQGRFRSFYHRGQLFRLTESNDAFEWSVFDAPTGKSLYTKTLQKEESLRQRKIFYRTNTSMEVMHLPLYGMIAQMSEPALVVENADSPAGMRIVTGSYYNSKGVALAGGATPLALIMGLIVSNVVNQLENPPGETKYFYLKGNVQEGFDFEPVENNPSPSLRQVIDDYEISRTSGVPKNEEKWSWFLTYKGYLEFDDGALGIYQENRKKNKKLILMKFSKGKA